MGSMVMEQYSIFLLIDCKQVRLIKWMNYSITNYYFNLGMAIFLVFIKVDYWTTIIEDYCNFRRAIAIGMSLAIADSTFMLATWMVKATMSIIMVIYIDSIM